MEQDRWAVAKVDVGKRMQDAWGKEAVAASIREEFGE